MAKANIYLSDELYAELRLNRRDINMSKVCQQALRAAVAIPPPTRRQIQDGCLGPVHDHLMHWYRVGANVL